MLYRIDWQSGVVLAVALSLLAAPGSAMMTASVMVSSDGVAAMTTTVL